MSIIIAIHVIACIGLIFFILIQSGRGGGLIESFSSADSMFGTKTNAILAKATTFFAVTFFITCLVLAFLSVQQNKSIVEREVSRQAKETAEFGEVAQKATEVVQETASGLVPEVSQETAELVNEFDEMVEQNLEEQTKILEETNDANAATEESAATIQ